LGALLALKPFLKWAGGKRWLVERGFKFPKFEGRYIEPFLGGGAVFFHLNPERALLSDLNGKLISAYQSLKDNWPLVQTLLQEKQNLHSKDFYYLERSAEYSDPEQKAAQFIYLNRSCWNGLYRENLKGTFNVPKGTKDRVIFDYDDFEGVSNSLKNAELICRDFEETIDDARDGDLLFIDPPYTTAHNLNGFVKYNQNIFKWEDQVRLRNAIVRAAARNTQIVLTNAFHQSILDLYTDVGDIEIINRASVISGLSKGRSMTQELCVKVNVH
jgi:DNA adenine methylase